MALVAENRAEWVVAFLACLHLGAVVVPMNLRLGPTELGRQLEVAAPRLALHSEACEELLGQAAPTLARRRLERDASGAIWQEPATAGGIAPPAAAAPGLVSFTSGTTGRPKGAVIAQGALATSAAVYGRLLGTTPDTTTLVLVPLFHNTGFLDQLAQMLVVGGSVDLLRRFGVQAALDALAHRPASYLIGVPSMIRLMMLDPRAGAAFDGCRILAYGGAPMPPAWIEELHARWPAIRPYNIYGLTEFTSLSHALEPADAIARADTVGRPVERVRQRIVADGADAPAGDPGEVWLAGPTRMLGYLDDTAATADAFCGPWLRTGDVGAIDADGFLTLHGRIAEVIVRGGEKIHASQVESELGALDSVAEAAVVGVPDEILHERVVGGRGRAPGAPVRSRAGACRPARADRRLRRAGPVPRRRRAAAQRERQDRPGAGPRRVHGGAAMTRGAIRQAAAERFFHQGYEATTVREIADALDIRAASIYYHYPDKQQILFELIDSTMTLLTDGVRAAVAAEPAPADQLVAVVVHHVVLHALRPLEATLGETELRSLTGERLELAVAQSRRLRGDRARRARARHRRPGGGGADPKLAAYAVIAMCTNVGIWYRPDGRLSLPEVAGAYATMAARLVGAAPPDPALVGRALQQAAAAYTI